MVYFFGLGTLVLAQEFVKDVFVAFCDVNATFVVREKVAHWNIIKFFVEEVALIEEQYHACFCEPATVANFLKKIQSFFHAILCVVFVEHLVVLAHGGDEYHGGDIVEAVNPFLSFIALPAHVIHDKRHLIDDVFLLYDPACPYSRPQPRKSKNKIRGEAYTNSNQ